MKYPYIGLLALMLVVGSGVYAQETTDLDVIKRTAGQGQLIQALAMLDKRIAADSNDVQARFLRGLLLLEQGDATGARDNFAEIARDFPRLPEAFNNLAAIYASEGEYESARQALLSASANAPDYPDVQANLGDLYTKMAFDAYRRALELNPSDKASEAKLRLLEQMFASGG